MRRIARLAVVAGAVAAFAAPAAPASADCTGTFIPRCVRELIPETQSSDPICVIYDDTTGTYVCV